MTDLDYDCLWPLLPWAAGFAWLCVGGAVAVLAIRAIAAHDDHMAFALCCFVVPFLALVVFWPAVLIHRALRPWWDGRGDAP